MNKEHFSKKLHEEEQRHAQLIQALDVLSNRMGSTAQLLAGAVASDVLFSGTIMLDANGNWRRSHKIPFASFSVSNPGTKPFIVSDTMADPTGIMWTGAGYHQVLPAMRATRNLLARDIFITGGTPNAMVDVEIYARPREARDDLLPQVVPWTVVHVPGATPAAGASISDLINEGPAQLLAISSSFNTGAVAGNRYITLQVWDQNVTTQPMFSMAFNSISTTNFSYNQSWSVGGSFNAASFNSYQYGALANIQLPSTGIKVVIGAGGLQAGDSFSAADYWLATP